MEGQAHAQGADDAFEAALANHERTEHHPGHYAPFRGFLDGVMQRDPFRSTPGDPRVDLPDVPPGAAHFHRDPVT